MLKSDTAHWLCAGRKIHWGAMPLLMGIVNVTPDSFSDGGKFLDSDRAIEHAMNLIEAGADILDTGGESSRPGAVPISTEEECARVVPVVEALVRKTPIPISIDTVKSEVARRCLDLGAVIINDITGFRSDPAMIGVIQKYQAGIVVMHMQGNPQTMQIAPNYQNVVSEINDFFRERIQSLRDLGIPPESIVLDPGIGFGKTLEHNLEILHRIESFQQFGLPVCLGVSRKGFIGQITGRAMPDRVHGSIAVLCQAMMQSGVQIARIHDVGATRDALRMIHAIQTFNPGH